MTLAKQPPGSEEGGEGARPLTSFQPPVRTQEQQDVSGGANASNAGETVPPIPEPDYSSDEEGGGAEAEKKKSNESKNLNGDLQQQGSSGGKPGSSDHPAVKHLTSTATVVFRSSSPVAGAGGGDGQQTSNDQQTNGKTFTTKNMFEELREQSAKITNSARARFATDGRQNSTTGGTEDQVSGDQSGKNTSSILKRGNSQEGEVSNVMKNVAEFEKMRLGAKEMAAARMAAAANGVTTSTNGVTSNGTTAASAAADLSNMRMSKSCIEELHAANSLKRGGKFGC